MDPADPDGCLKLLSGTTLAAVLLVLLVLVLT
jgi:hypothetical protein